MHRETFDTYALVIDTSGALSPKEEVEAAAICLGRTTKESAKLRAVSPETCKCQRAAAKAKVEAGSQCEFILTLVARGWLKLEGDAARFSRIHCRGKISATIAVSAPSFMETQFHRAQARLQSNPRCVRWGQKVVGPVFYEPATGSQWSFDLPTYLRRRVERMAQSFADRDRERMAAYTQKVYQRFQQAEGVA